MWAIIQHLAWEGPGLIGEEMRARGISFRVHRMDQGAAVPDASQIEGLVVMGGTMAVYEAGQYPYLAQEQKLIAACVAAGTPVLGVCLGAQLMAAALGGTVARGPVFEVGAGEVELTAAGREDAVICAGGSARLPVVHWHQDTYTLPAGATLLASSGLYAQQAFRAGARAYGMQFHCEVHAELAAAWRQHGMDLDAGAVARVEQAGRGVVGRFLALRG